MSIDLKLSGWESKGLRCPDLSISLMKDDASTYPISMIQMPNGTGKTTTLSLLKATLSNAHAIQQWDAEKVLSYRKHNSGISSGYFRTKMLYNGTRLTFTLDFDFDNGMIEIFTTLQSGQKKGFHPPQAIEKILRKDFVDFFIFDGELAEHLIDPKFSDAETVITDLFQIKNIQIVNKKVDDYWNSEVSGRGATKKKGFVRRKNKVESLEERIALLEDKRAKTTQEFEDVKSKINQLEKIFENLQVEVDEKQEALKEVNSSITNLENDIRINTDRIIHSIKNPAALSNVFKKTLVNFKESLDRVKLPESAAKEFFTELAQEDLCICGRPLDDTSRSSLITRASNYLGSDDVALLNAMKTQINDERDLDENLEMQFKQYLEELQNLKRDSAKLQTKRNRLETEAGFNDPNLAEDAIRLQELRSKKNVLRFELDSFDDPTDSAKDEDTVGIIILKRRLTEAENMLAEATETMVLKKKRDIVNIILNDAYQESRDAICDTVVNEANIRINELMPYNKIRLARISRSLVLAGKQSGSSGENLSVAYAFLSTIFQRSDHSLPFVVDSPANPIDLEIRPKIASIIPLLADQFVAFIISSERNCFLKPLEEVCPSIQYLTVFRKGSPVLENSARLEVDFDESDNGILVHGRKFFKKFHKDEED